MVTQEMERIKVAVDQNLGEGTSDLVFKTLKLVYHVDEEAIASDPDLFKEKIRELLGDPAAETILKAVEIN